MTKKNELDAKWFGGMWSVKVSQKLTAKENRRIRNAAKRWLRDGSWRSCEVEIEIGKDVLSRKPKFRFFGNASKLPNDPKLSDDSCVARLLPKQET